jgi:hypothetical protein
VKSFSSNVFYGNKNGYTFLSGSVGLAGTEDSGNFTCGDCEQSQPQNNLTVILAVSISLGVVGLIVIVFLVYWCCCGKKVAAKMINNKKRTQV